MKLSTRTKGETTMDRIHERTKALLRLAAAVGLATTMLLGACADPEDIDRTQPDLLSKEDFQGEWYVLDTVVRAPYASSRAFPGLQGDLQRGVWEIEKDYLIFYRTYEFIEGLEQQGIKSDTDTPLLDEEGNPVTYDKTLPDGSTVEATRYVYRSTPLARYAIAGHYDVRREYNPLTGEEGNVIVEDSSEKFWWERDHMRVELGTDHALNLSRLWQTWAPGSYASVYEGETGPDGVALQTSEDGQYMDFVTRHIWEAPRSYLQGWGFVPTCLFFPWYTGAYFECDTEEYHIRTSFMRVPEDNSYEPLQYSDHMLGKFGYYRSSRGDWDKFHGLTYSDAERNIRRFRIWEEFIEAEDGSLDYANMTPKPIVYYLSEDFPRELIGGALDLADQWNEPFVEVVRALHDPSWEGRMFVLCENNNAEVEEILAEDPDAVLAETDPEYCEDMDEPKRMGDMRYHQLVSVNDPIQYGLYGYGPMHSDPITGEIVQANAFNYTANMRLGARNAMDMIEYEAGVQTFKDITDAEHIIADVKADALKNTQGEPSRTGEVEQARQVAAGVVPANVEQRLSTQGIRSTDVNLARAGMSRLKGAQDFDFIWKNADMAALAGLPVDDLQNVQDPDGFLKSLVHPSNMASEDWMLWGHDQDTRHGQEAMCMGKFFDDTFRGVGLQYKPEYDQAVCEGLRGRDDLIFDFSVFNEPGAACDGDASACGDDQVCTFLDQGEVSGEYCVTPCSTRVLLQQLRDEIRRVNQINTSVYWDPNALYEPVKDERVRKSQLAAREIIEDVRERIFWQVFDRIWSTVAIHEVGHNVGLRHNFASSTDALNFFPEYWDLKGFVGEDGKWHPKNLWKDDTDEQVAARIREYQQSSIMEYGSGFNSAWQGLGAYDHAAVHFGYGQLVEVFSTPPDLTELQDYMAEPEDDQPTNYPASVVRREAPLAQALRKVHHTAYPNVFGSVDTMQDRKLVHWRDVVAYEQSGSGAIVPKECDAFDDPYDSSVCGEAGSYCQPFPTGFYCTKPDMVEVPFRFCSDEYAATEPYCQRRDEGADTFEIVNNSIDDYEEYWPFVGYRRDNDLFNPSTGYWRYVMGSQLEWRKQFEHWAYNFARYNQNDWWEKKFGVPWHMDVNGGLAATIAAKQIFEYMANILGRPNDSYYGWNVDKEQYEPVVLDGADQYTNFFQVREDRGGRPMYPSYDYDGYLYTPARAGTIYDRLAAIQLMTYPQMIFVQGTDTTYDIRRFSMSFAEIWPQRMQNILAALLTSEPAAYGWCVEHNGPGPNVDGNGDPIGVKPRIWFGSEAELDDYYADENCVPMQPEPRYSFPTTQYRLPALAMVYGVGYMSQAFDRTFVDRTRLWLEGEGADVSISPEFETIEYTDPLSGKVYTAGYDPAEFDPTVKMDAREMVPSYDIAPHGHVYWPAARLLALANQYKADLETGTGGLNADSYKRSALQQLVGRLEIIRGLYRRMDFGY
ncbi:MAG: hypothetical protein ACQEXJ_21645 [Myxococcota bacterium]